MLASLFLLAIVIDVSQPTQAAAATYATLIFYVAFATAMVALTWRNWWADARLSGLAHAVDIVVFTALVLVTQGYTSPFFIFFIFVLLSAAIRWGWRETALTAILLVLLFLVMGLMDSASGQLFELQRFIVRTGQLVILSLILIWFGINQWGSRLYSWDDEGSTEAFRGVSPLEAGLHAAINAARAGVGSFVWVEKGEVTGLAMRDGHSTTLSVGEGGAGEAYAATTFLYDLPRNRALRRDEERNLRAMAPRDTIGEGAARGLSLREGLAIPVRWGAGEGLLFLEEVPNLSIDHIDLGDQISSSVAVHFQRHALLKAAEESAEARSRLSLARDLHDSVVQFLAGAAFRLEAMKRSVMLGREVEPDLDELKQLMLQEQVELRSFITALRGGSEVAVGDLARDIKALSERLSRQWDVHCDFSAKTVAMKIPARLHLDVQQMVREAVANAARHAGARSVIIKLAAAPDEIRIEFTNDGTRYPRKGKSLELPQSLRERVEQAGGAIEISRGMGVTKLSISLPVGGI